MPDPRSGYKCRNLTSALRVGWTTGQYFFFWWIALEVSNFLFLFSLLFALSIGLYVQHQFEGTHGQRTTNWTFAEASVRGSSDLSLPGVLERFFVYINIRHVRHLYRKTPGYHLKRRVAELPVTSQNNEITLLDSIRSFRLKLWDEDAQKMVCFPVASRPEP